jgi:hypothetical protein
MDIATMNIPHYPEIVTHPMDFSTIELKLNSSNPTKPDLNPENSRHQTTDQSIADVRLVFTNYVEMSPVRTTQRTQVVLALRAFS